MLLYTMICCYILVMDCLLLGINHSNNRWIELKSDMVRPQVIIYLIGLLLLLGVKWDLGFSTEPKNFSPGSRNNQSNQTSFIYMPGWVLIVLNLRKKDNAENSEKRWKIVKLEWWSKSQGSYWGYNMETVIEALVCFA